eukprot:TRINITY_DN1083_c0_g1_i2.p1 TRINITY_DN1083_c0_g1~~TRINITY_DN1083_c0_g1_i2.p1  ORF type:complete len:611 (-),score=107.07 TRINITY_DN1083_c0_g1_i2:75-1907(-)
MRVYYLAKFTTTPSATMKKTYKNIKVTFKTFAAEQAFVDWNHWEEYLEDEGNQQSISNSQFKVTFNYSNTPKISFSALSPLPFDDKDHVVCHWILSKYEPKTNKWRFPLFSPEALDSLTLKSDYSDLVKDIRENTENGRTKCGWILHGSHSRVHRIVRELNQTLDNEENPTILSSEYQLNDYIMGKRRSNFPRLLVNAKIHSIDQLYSMINIVEKYPRYVLIGICAEKLEYRDERISHYDVDYVEAKVDEMNVSEDSTLDKSSTKTQVFEHEENHIEDADFIHSSHEKKQPLILFPSKTTLCSWRGAPVSSKRIVVDGRQEPIKFILEKESIEAQGCNLLHCLTMITGDKHPLVLNQSFFEGTSPEYFVKHVERCLLYGSPKSIFIDWDPLVFWGFKCGDQIFDWVNNFFLREQISKDIWVVILFRSEGTWRILQDSIPIECSPPTSHYLKVPPPTREEKIKQECKKRKICIPVVSRLDYPVWTSKIVEFLQSKSNSTIEFVTHDQVPKEGCFIFCFNSTFRWKDTKYGSELLELTNAYGNNVIPLLIRTAVNDSGMNNIKPFEHNGEMKVMFDLVLNAQSNPPFVLYEEKSRNHEMASELIKAIQMKSQ